MCLFVLFTVSQYLEIKPTKMDEPMAKRAKHDTFHYYCEECIVEFPSQIKLTEHLISVHNQSINIIPIEVFENIIEHLHPNDLVELSETCHKCKYLIANYFERKHLCGWIRIFSEKGKPKFHFYHNEKYEIYFRTKIRNIVISINDSDSVVKLFQFIRENC